MSQQRQVVYGKRSQALHGEFKVDFIARVTEELVAGIAERHAPETLNTEAWDLKNVSDELKKQFGLDIDLSALDPNETSKEAIAQEAREKIVDHYEKKLNVIDASIRQKIENYVYLQIIDQAWKEHLLSMDALKDAVSLRGYGQRDPLQEYKKEAFNLFTMMMDRVDSDCTLALFHMPPPDPRLASEMMDDFDGPEDEHPELLARKPEPKTDESKLIYHGSRENNQPEEKASAQPARREGEKVGRNSPCPCGSGKKFKKCHGQPGDAAQA